MGLSFSSILLHLIHLHVSFHNEHHKNCVPWSQTIHDRRYLGGLGLVLWRVWKCQWTLSVRCGSLHFRIFGISTRQVSLKVHEQLLLVLAVCLFVCRVHCLHWLWQTLCWITLVKLSALWLAFRILACILFPLLLERIYH